MFACANGVNKFLSNSGCKNILLLQCTCVLILMTSGITIKNFMLLRQTCEPHKESVFHSLKQALRYLLRESVAVDSTKSIQNKPNYLQDKKNNLISLKLKNVKLHLIRAIFYCIGAVAWYKAIARLSITQTTLTSFISPIFSIIASIMFFKDKLTIRRFFIILISTIGSILIVFDSFYAPSNTTYDIVNSANNSIAFFNINWSHLFENHLSIILPFIAHIAYVGCDIISKKLSQKGESTLAIVFYSLLFSFPILLIIGDFSTSSVEHILYIIILSIIAIVAYYCQAASIGMHDIIGLMPFGFIRKLFSCLIGMYFFHEIITTKMLLGSAVIMITLVYANFIETGNKSTSR
jgi:drug/metabolite transporter (DMT)-like permease